MNVKKISRISALFFLCFALTGCSGKEDYSEQSYDIMATYISQTIMKYDKNMEYKLEHIDVPEDEKEEDIKEPEENEEDAKEPEDEEETKEPEKVEDDKESDDNKGEENKTLEDVLQSIGFKLTYKNCQVVENYTDGKYCNIQPGKDKRICIITFDMKNTSGQDKKVTLLPDGVFYKLKVDGKAYTALHTIMDNDLHYLDVKIKANKSEEVILLFEVDKDKLESEKELIITSDIGSYSKKIK